MEPQLYDTGVSTMAAEQKVQTEIAVPSTTNFDAGLALAQQTKFCSAFPILITRIYIFFAVFMQFTIVICCK